MTGWADALIEPIHLAYGLAFFTLGVIALVLPKRDTTLPFAGDLWLLATFGLLHGLLEFVEWARLAYASPRLGTLSGLLAILSYIPLLEFGRRLLARAHTPARLPALLLYGASAASIAVFVLAADDPFAGLTVGARLFIGTPGALLTGFALFALPGIAVYSHDDAHGLRRGLNFLAAAFLAYGALTPFITAPVAGLPGWLPTTGDFAEATGLPIQLLRAACAGIASVALILLVREAGTRRAADMARILGTLRGIVYRCANNRDWSMLFLSGDAEELTGYPRAAFFGRRPVTLGGLIHPDDAPRIWNEVQ